MKSCFSISRLLYVLAFGIWGFVGFGQGLEDFTNSNASGSYNDSSFIGNNSITWSYIESRDGNGDTNGSGINLPALMLRNASDNSRITSNSISGGIGNFSVKLYKGFTGTGNRQVELFVNGVSQGTSIPFDNFNEQIFTVNNINISGNIVIEIRNITSKQVIIDDINWTGYTAGPNISLSETSISGLNYIQGNGPSTAQFFEVSGTNLDGSNVIVTSPTNFEISNSEFGTYSNSITLNAFDGTSTPIWVRMQSGLVFGNYNGILEISGGGASQVDLPVDGNVTGEIIVQQDFDSSAPEWNYTNDVVFFDDSWGTAFYGLIDESLASPLDNTNFTGNILGENDLQSTNGTNGIATVSFENINISGYTNVQLSFDYQFVNYNANDDEGSYEIFENEMGQGQVFLADGSIPTLENTGGNESVFISSGINEIALNYLLENDGNTGYSGIDNIQLTGLANDTDTQINPPTTQVAVGDIVVDQATNATNSVPVFKFDVQDIGGDGLVTELTHIRIIPGSNNTANWGDVIAGIRLEGNGNNVSQGDQIPTIENDEIIIEVTTNNGELTINNNDSKEFTISVFLDPNFAVEGEVIQMAIDDSNDHFFVNPSGSMMSRNITGFEGTEHTIQIEGNKLEFIIDPSTTIINEAMSAVEVAYTDNLGNIDTDFTNQVIISSSGTLTGDPISINAIDGIASFSSLIHTVLGNNLTLTASSVGESDIVSPSFNIIAMPELFISEVADPFDDFDGRFVELYNAGTTMINFDSQDYFLARQANAGSVFAIKLNGTIEAKGYFIIGKDTDFNNLYGFNPDNTDLADPATVSGNGDDSYFISKNGPAGNGTALKNSRIDIYGVLEVDGTGESWEYLDSRAYRNNPTVKNASTSWNINEWTVEFPSTANVADMTPGYGDNDYVYNGSWTNIGLGDPNSTTPTNAQNIFVRSGTVSLTQDTTIGDLVVRSEGELILAPNVKLAVNGDIVNEGTIIFDSDATGTAVLEPLPTTSRVVGNGFEVRRFIPIVQAPTPKRAFRYLSSSVTTTSTINENWQEGAITGDFNPNPTFGTHITGGIVNGTVGVVDGDGFDETSTGNPSMWSWNESIQDWASIPNTMPKTFNVGDAYAVLIRGDRSASLNSNTLAGPSTTLRTTGQIHVGDFEVTGLSNTIGHFNLVGNPYQSQVNLKQLLDSSNSNSQDLNEQFVYIWDPTLGTLGGYATIDITSVGGNPVPVSSDANEYLQPQQAFFVETDGTNPQLTFSEGDKNNGTGQTAVFSEETPNFSVLDLTLKSDDNRTYDGLRLVYGPDYSNGIDQMDATKFWNYTDNMCILSNNSYLSVEKRNIPSGNEETTLNLFGFSLNQYHIEGRFYADDPSFSIYLKDHYTGQTSEILPNINFSYAFSFDPGIPETMATNRFSLQYGHTTLAVNSHNFGDGFSLYPNPNSNGNFSIMTTQLSGDVQVEILNLLGQQVFVQNLTVEGQQVNVTAENLSSGIYVVKLSQAGQIFSTKLMVE